MNNCNNRITTTAAAMALTLVLVLHAAAFGSENIVPIGTDLRIRLDSSISSKIARVGDQFTATVVEGRYDRATIYGHVTEIKPSGRFKGATEMYLSFDEIRLPDETRSPLRAEIRRLYDSETGEYVDAEGGIETKKRGNQALKRTGIGALAGGVFGAIFSGAGAAIGSVAGGAAGAGSLSHSKELVLEEGTEMLIRTIR